MEKTSKSVWGLLVIAWAALACTQIITFSYGMMLPSIMAEFKIDYEVAGLIGSIAGIVSVLVTIPIALLSNKFKVRIIVPIIVGAIAIGFALFGLANNVAMLFIGKIVAAVFINGISTSLAIFKMEKVSMDQMGQANGIENFVGPIGQVLATLVITQIMLLVGGWRGVHIIIAVVMAVLCIVWLVLYKKDAKEDEASAKTQKQKNYGLAEHPLKTAVKEKTFWLLALAWPGTTIVWMGMFIYFPSYAMSSLNLTQAQAGLVLSMIPIFSAIASLTSPQIAKWIGKDKPLIWPCGFLLPIFYFMMLQTSNIYLLCLFAGMAGYICYFFVPLAFTTMYKLGYNPKVVSMGVAMVFTGVAVGSAVAAGVVGVAIKAMGGNIYNALAICCLSPILFGVLTMFIPERGRKWMDGMQAAAAAAAEAKKENK